MRDVIRVRQSNRDPTPRRRRNAELDAIAAHQLQLLVDDPEQR